MKNNGMHAAIRELGTLFNEGAVGMLSDGQLLDRFVERSDASAFEAIVERYGPLVWGVCRRVLRHHHDAEDAFQATFLVFARRAASILSREKLGNWLYGVAYQTALKVRATRGKRRVRERPACEMTEPEAVTDEHAEELLSWLDREVARLPEKYRMPIILCELERKTHQQAAGLLGWPVGTVSGRLSRARALLARRLSRRDMPLTAGVLAVPLAHDAARAGVPADLVRSTAQAASLSMAGKAAMAGLVSARVAALTGEVLKSMLLNKFKVATAMLLVTLALAAGGTSFVGLPAAVQETAKFADSVTIRVVDDRGRPISGADVWMQVILHDNTKGTLTEWPTGHGTTDGRGSYLMPVPEGRRPPPKDRRYGLLVLVWAHAPGHRLATANAWKALYREAQSVDLTLGPLTNTEFLVLDPKGKPVAGATVEPREVLTAIGLTYSPAPTFILPILEAVTGADGRARVPALPYETFRWVQITTPSLGIQHQRLPDPPLAPQREIHLRSTGKIFGRIVADRPEWTRGVKLSITTTSDPVDRDTKGIAEVVSRADGLFLIPAIAGGHARFELAVDPVRPVLPRIPDVGVQPDAVTNVEIRLERTVRLRGSIRDRENGHPVARAEILIGHGAPKEGEKGVSDSEGRFEVNTLPGDVTMQVVSAPSSFVQVGDDPSSQRHHVPAGVEAFDLPPIEVLRGVKIQGRLVDAANQPIAFVSIYADAASGNRQYGAGTTDHDGAFTMLIPSGVALKYRYSFDQGGVPEGLDPVGEAPIVRDNPLLLRTRSRKGPRVAEGQP